MTIQCRTILSLVLAVSTFVPHISVAATLLNQPPSGISGVFSDEAFDIFLNQYGHTQSVAENFQVTTGNTGFLLEEVVIWGAFEPFAGSTFPLWDDIDVLVHADDNGLPGTVLCAESGVAANRQSTGETVAERNEYMVTLTLSVPCGLSDGNYWIEVYYNTGIGYDDWFWEFGTVDPTYGLPNAAYAEQNPGIWWDQMTTIPFNETAVQLNGTLGTVACVDNPTDLQAALTAAGLNDAVDVVQVVQGTYLTPGARFTYSTVNNADLQLLGGFTAGCTDRAVIPVNTILDGGGNNPVLSLQPQSSTTGDLHVQGFTITGGVASGNDTGGLAVGNPAGFGGRITVDHNSILGNQADLGAAGLRADTSSGLLEVVNNLIADNTSVDGHAAGVLSCSGETVWLTNNTVADNSCAGCTGGLEISGSTAPHISNNILWANDNFDLVFTHPAASLRHNDIGSYSGTPGPESSGNVSVNPLFIGAPNFRLQNYSPVTNIGTNNPAGGLPTHDLDGRARAKDGKVDMGAFENPPIFIAGFEDPLLSDWSLVIGLE